MAKLLSTIKRFIGNSTERKPMDCPNASTFFEEDTGNMKVFYEDKWVLKEEANISMRLETIHRLSKLLDEAKKTNETLELIAESVSNE